MADTLASIGKALGPEEFTSYVLNGPGDDYENLVENINGRDTPIQPRTGRGARLELLDEQPPASPRMSAEPARDAAPSPGVPTGLAEPSPTTSLQHGAGHAPAEPVELAEPVSPKPSSAARAESASLPALAEPASTPSLPGRSLGAISSASGERSASSSPSSSTSSPL
nr:predicted GPI-anchored protein 58 [Aegilops tauschii subsp. strangulata]